MEEVYYQAVYGTLRLGGVYNHIIVSGKQLATVRLAGWRMYDFRGMYPYAVEGSLDDSITVELWQIDAVTLGQVDALEDYPDDYQRKLVRLECEGFGLVDAYIYYTSKEKVAGLARVESGDWFER